jgi:putative sterol carrier protein
MTDATTEFFEELARRGHEPLLAKLSGTARFELVDNGSTDHWLVAIEKGDVTVSHRDGPADMTLRAEKKLFDGVATGEVNGMAALMRGALTLDGGWGLMVLFQRLFPSPPAKSQRPGAKAAKGRKKS